MIQKNTAIPYEVNQRFVTTSPNQQRIHIYVLEGEVVRSGSLHADCRVSDRRPAGGTSLGLAGRRDLQLRQQRPHPGHGGRTVQQEAAEHRDHPQPGIGQSEAWTPSSRSRRTITSSSDRGDGFLEARFIHVSPRGPAYDDVGRLQKLVGHTGRTAPARTLRAVAPRRVSRMTPRKSAATTRSSTRTFGNTPPDNIRSARKSC